MLGGALAGSHDDSKHHGHHGSTQWTSHEHNEQICRQIPGSWINSARNYTFDTECNVLTADLQSENGRWNRSTVRVNHGVSYSNNNGHFQEEYDEYRRHSQGYPGGHLAEPVGQVPGGHFGGALGAGMLGGAVGGLPGGMVGGALGAGMLDAAMGHHASHHSPSPSRRRRSSSSSSEDGGRRGWNASGQHHKRCFKCEGRGFCHDSNMDHDKPWDQKCFFCKKCDGCGGSGHLTEESSGWGGGWCQEVRKERCYRCEGRGFTHDSSMDHDKPWDEKCFFCKQCPTCHGRGHCTH